MSKNKYNAKLVIGSLVVSIVVVSAITNYSSIFKKFLPQYAASATYYDLRGQAWSDTIGWISFNCLEGSPTGTSICGTSNYKVSTDATGTLKGYAWSDNIGWISFNETVGCPTLPCQGMLTASGLTGWARAVSPFIPSDPNPDRGGWDGWIELSRASGPNPYAVGRTGNDLTGQAWGDLSVGWISFNCSNGGMAGANICATSNYKVYVTATTTPDPTLVFTVPTHVFTSATTTYPATWSTTNADACYASSSWSGAKAMPGGSQNIGPFPSEGNFAYGMTCYNYTYNLNVVASRLVNVTNGICDVSETVPGNPYDCTSVVNRFEANPKIVRENKRSKLEWNISNGQSCAIYTPTNALYFAIPNGNNIGSTSTPPITTKTVYRLSCLGNVNSYTTVSPYILFEY